MKTIKDYIAEALILEKFVTLFDDHIDDRMKYSKEIWDMVERAYAYMGGLSGCETYEEFVKKYVEDEKGKDLIFTAVMQTKPEAELGKYKGIEIKKIEYNVTEEDINHELGHMQEHNSRLITIEEVEEFSVIFF